MLTDAQRAQFDGKFAYEVWGPAETGTVVRFCTSWATTRANVDALLAAIAAL